MSTGPLLEGIGQSDRAIASTASIAPDGSDSTRSTGNAVAHLRPVAAKGNRPSGAVGRMAYHHGDLGNALLNEALRRVTEHEPRSIVGRKVALAAKVAPSAAYRYVARHGHVLAVVSRWAREAHLSHP